MTINKKEKQKTYRTEKINLNEQQCQDVDKVCWEVKNLYNEALFIIRQNLIFKDVNAKYCFGDEWEEYQKNLTKYSENETGKWIRYGQLDKLFKKHTDQEHPYRKLHSQTAQQTLKMIEANFKSSFQSFKDYKKNPDKYT